MRPWPRPRGRTRPPAQASGNEFVSREFSREHVKERGHHWQPAMGQRGAQARTRSRTAGRRLREGVSRRPIGAAGDEARCQHQWRIDSGRGRFHRDDSGEVARRRKCRAAGSACAAPVSCEFLKRVGTGRLGLRRRHQRHRRCPLLRMTHHAALRRWSGGVTECMLLSGVVGIADRCSVVICITEQHVHAGNSLQRNRQRKHPNQQRSKRQPHAQYASARSQAWAARCPSWQPRAVRGCPQSSTRALR